MGSDLIVLVSQPRAGSTLVQRLVASHSEVATTSEPWLLLPLLAWREPQLVREARYDDRLARLGVRTFLESMPDGEAAYREGVRRMGAYLYDRAVEGTGATTFLDKTPRYYYILPDIHQTFPDARIIVLLRNPLSVLASVLTTWIGDDWLSLHRYRDDLLEAPARLIDAAGASHVSVVRYEDLVQDPKATLRGLCDDLGLAFEPGMLTYESSADASWALGDQTRITTEQRPMAKSVEKWKRLAAEDPQAWQVLTDYLDRLGPATLERMGYDAGACRRALHQRAPASTRGLFSLDWLLRKPYGDRHLLERAAVRLQNAFLSGGLRTVARMLTRKASVYADRLFSSRRSDS